jgi:hypothetical protein
MHLIVAVSLGLNERLDGLARKNGVLREKNEIDTDCLLAGPLTNDVIPDVACPSSRPASL